MSFKAPKSAMKTKEKRAQQDAAAEVVKKRAQQDAAAEAAMKNNFAMFLATVFKHDPQHVPPLLDIFKLLGPFCGKYTGPKASVYIGLFRGKAATALLRVSDVLDFVLPQKDDFMDCVQVDIGNDYKIMHMKYVVPIAYIKRFTKLCNAFGYALGVGQVPTLIGATPLPPDGNLPCTLIGPPHDTWKIPVPPPKSSAAAPPTPPHH